MTFRLRARLNNIPYLVLWAIVLFLVAAPIALMALASFKGGTNALPLEPGPFTLRNYRQAFLDPDTATVIINTLAVGIFSVAITLCIAGAMAWTTQRTNAPLRKLIYLSMLLPIGIPGMLLAIAWVLIFNPQNGVFNVLLRGAFGFEAPGPINIYSLAGICVLQGIYMVPSAFLMISGALSQMDPTLEEAALASGASWRQVISHVTLPVMLPAFLATGIYFFISAIEAFEIPGVIGLGAGIPVLSSRIYWGTHPGGGLPEYGYVAALATPFVFLSIALLYFYSRVTAKSEKFTTITGRGYRPRVIDLGALRWIPTIVAGLYLIVTIISPLAVLLWGSLLPYWVNPSMQALNSLSFEAYRITLEHPGVARALYNTAIVTLTAATITMLLASIVSWCVVRTNRRGRYVLDMLAFLPHSIPGIVIGLALIFTYLTIPAGIYGTVWIIVIACVTRYLPFAVRTMNAAQVQVSKELEEAASTSGASIFRMLVTIVFPLLALPFRNGWLWVAMHAARELSAAVMLYGPGSVVLSTVLWSMWQNGRFSESCVLGVVLLGITMTLGLVGGRFGGKRLEAR